MTLPHDRSRLLVDDRVPSEIFSQSMDRWIETMLADDVSEEGGTNNFVRAKLCLLYTSPSPRDATLSRMPSSA